MSLLLDAPGSTSASARQLGFDWLNDVSVESPVVAKPVVAKPNAAAPKVLAASPRVATGIRARLGEPQKLGAAMLKLLKRYGITDAEIEAGMEAYAQRMSSR